MINASQDAAAGPIEAAAQVRMLAERIARAFRPERIILFGSRAWGTPHAYSDVDLLVVLPFEGRSAAKALEILRAADVPFAVDLIVYTPERLQERLAQNDFFLLDIMQRGRVLYDAAHAGMG